MWRTNRRSRLGCSCPLSGRYRVNSGHRAPRSASPIHLRASHSPIRGLPTAQRFSAIYNLRRYAEAYVPSFHIFGSFRDRAIQRRRRPMSAITPTATKILRCRDCPLSARSDHAETLAFMAITRHWCAYAAGHGKAGSVRCAMLKETAANPWRGEFRDRVGPSIRSPCLLPGFPGPRSRSRPPCAP